MPRTVQRKDGDVVWSECPECHKKIDLMEKQWTYDRYGIPWKKVCPDCYDEVQERIDRYEYDFLDAGEYLDDDY